MDFVRITRHITREVFAAQQRGAPFARLTGAATMDATRHLERMGRLVIVCEEEVKGVVKALRALEAPKMHDLASPKRAAHPVAPRQVQEASPAPPAQDRWLVGDCHVLTIALQQLTGWPIVTLHDGRIRCGVSWPHDFGMLVHSGVRMPDGRFLDAAGPHAPQDREAVADRYLQHTGCARWVYPEEDEITAEELRSILPQPDLDVLLREAAEVARALLARVLTGARMEVSYMQDGAVREGFIREVNVEPPCS